MGISDESIRRIFARRKGGLGAIMDSTMDWHGEEQRDLKNGREFKRRHRRDPFKHLAGGAYWAALLALLFALFVCTNSG